MKKARPYTSAKPNDLGFTKTFWKRLGKGQSEVISAVIIFGIVVSLVGATYLWGVPLIKKQQAFTETEKIEIFMKSLADKIENVDKGGEGSREIAPIAENGIVTIDAPNEVVRFTTRLTGTFYVVSDEETAWNPVLWGPETLGIFGKDAPSIIRAKAQAKGDGYDVTYEIKFRPLRISGTTNNFTINITTSSTPDGACTNQETANGVKGQQLFISNEGRNAEGSEICIKIT